MDELKKMYNEVFDAEGNVRLCGRANCKELILLCDRLEADKSHGNLDAGFMDIECIKQLYARLVRNS